ncbi:MAG: GNAT family N-acetyltransferase, partial [Dehalococcoidales bacterium]|nr:GNAT family N-acetyltransferase [Dehalococcoidales bacterium]
MAYSIRRMERGDIPQVSRIDREAFPTQWPPPSYHNELQNRMAYYIVAIDDSRPLSDAGPSMPGAPRFRRWSGWWQRIFGKKQAPSSRVQDYIIGFAGIWLMVDEAHITNIAVTREYRGRGIGELLLLATIDLARKLGARIVTLEVRLSNTVAQNLYEKYGFTRAGIRHG